MMKLLNPPRRTRRDHRITLAKKTLQNAHEIAVAPETKTRMEDEEILKRMIRNTPAVLRYRRGLRLFSIVSSHALDIVCVVNDF